MGNDPCTSVTSTMPQGDMRVLSSSRGYDDDDPRQPLLHDPWLRNQKVHILLLLMLAIVLVAGLAISIWLFVISDISDRSDNAPDSPFELVDRTMWGARPPRNSSRLTSQQPVTRLVILHTVTGQCLEFRPCCERVREIQDLHMDKMHFDDIGYSFLVGGDGRTYEGHGADHLGAFSAVLNQKGLGIAFIGDFEHTAPPAEQLEEAQMLLKELVRRKKLSEDYKLVGHRQVSESLSPGEKLFEIIQTWPHWEMCYNQTC